MMVNVAVDGGAFLSLCFMKLHFQEVFIMSKRSVLVGLVLVALCAFLVLPVWAVEPVATDPVSGSGSLVFKDNIIYMPDITIGGFSSDSGWNGTFTQSMFQNGEIPFTTKTPPKLFDSWSDHTLTVTFSGNRTLHYFYNLTVPSFPVSEFTGVFSASLTFNQDVPYVRIGNTLATLNPSNSSQYYSQSISGSPTFSVTDCVISVFASDSITHKSSATIPVNEPVAPQYTSTVSASVDIDFVPAFVQFEFTVDIPDVTIPFKATGSAYSIGNRLLRCSPISNFGFFDDTNPAVATYSLITFGGFASNRYVDPFTSSFTAPQIPTYSFVSSSGSGGGTGGDSPDYTSLLNMIISKLDLIIQNMANSGSTDLSGVETRLDTIIQNLGEVSPMADFEDSYIQNFGGQLEGVESSLSGKDNSLPSGGDMTGFTGVLQSSLGIDSAGFSQSDFDSAVSSLGGDKIDEGMPWYFFTQAVADSMVTPPSGVSVHSDISPSDTWVSDSERWRRLWLTPY